MVLQVVVQVNGLRQERPGLTRLPCAQLRLAEPLQRRGLPIAIADTFPDGQGILHASDRILHPPEAEVGLAQVLQAFRLTVPVAELAGDVQGLLQVVDRLVVPAKLPARAAQDAQGDALAKAVPDLALDVERAQCGTTGLGKIPQPEVGVGDVGDRLGLSGAVPKLPAERKSLLET